MMTTIVLAAVLRDATLSTHGSAPTFGLPQALLVLVLAVLLIMLTGVVFFRVRRSSRTRSK